MTDPTSRLWSRSSRWNLMWKILSSVNKEMLYTGRICPFNFILDLLSPKCEVEIVEAFLDYKTQILYRIDET